MSSTGKSEAPYLEVVKFLLDQGARVNLETNAPLANAAEYNRCEIALELLDRGADIHGGKDCALHHAVDEGHGEMVKLLVDKGADIHSCWEQALKIAALKGRLDIFEFLVQKGADLDRIGLNHLQVAFDSAVQRGNTRAMNLILDHGARLDCIRPLYLAAQAQPQAMALLLERGADRAVAEKLKDDPETCAEARAVIQSFFLRNRLDALLPAADESPRPTPRQRRPNVL